jgi:iron(III) transport system substrate-binding protein
MSSKGFSMFMRLMLMMSIFLGTACQEKASSEKKQTLWIYTSLYKDTIADLTPKLEKDFPGVEFKWYQAGSEEIATKVHAEILSGNIQADVLISSDRFWYEEMARSGRLLAYRPVSSEKMSPALFSPEFYYHTLSLPVMVLAYNKEKVTEQEIPKTFKEMSDVKWMNKFTIGSPLASGTNFTTMAIIQKNYGWEYFEALKKNGVIADGGNSAVLRRIQSGERPIGWVLLENILRFQKDDQRLGVIYPEDGVIIHNNVMAILNKEIDRELAKKFTDWMFSQQGQEAMTRSFMYSPFVDFAPPVGAPPFAQILEKSFPWSKELLDEISQKRVELKEKYTEIMF